MPGRHEQLQQLRNEELDADLAGVLDPAGTTAESAAALWWFMAALGAVAFLVVLIGLVVGARRQEVEVDRTGIIAGEDTTATRGWLVWGGLALPIVMVIAVLVATIGSMRTVDVDESEASVVIEVTGHRWWWQVAYPEHGVVTANEVHIPVDEPILLRLRSNDVIHSFWVPELAGKLDLLPERTNELVIDAHSPGRYDGRCSEFCGLQHANMELVLIAHEPADFERWLADQAEPAAKPDSEVGVRGQALVVDGACSSCHTVRGTEADGTDGPDLTHVMSRDRLGAGVTETTPELLRAWIADPHGVKEGVAMPAAELSDSELDDLVSYLETLE